MPTTTPPTTATITTTTTTYATKAAPEQPMPENGRRGSDHTAAVNVTALAFLPLPITITPILPLSTTTATTTKIKKKGMRQQLLRYLTENKAHSYIQTHMILESIPYTLCIICV